MKKIIFFVSAFALLLTACSSDDSDPAPATPSGPLLKKMMLTSSDEDSDSYWNSTINFTYNGNKLVQYIDEDNYKAVFTYTGDLITKIEYFDDTILDAQDLFTYNSNGKLIEYRDINLLVDVEFRFTYTYNTNGTVTAQQYQGTVGNTSPVFSPDIYTFTNGELTNTNSGSITYDSKNNPFKNVTGYQEIITPEFLDDYLIAFGRNQNMTSFSVGTSTTEGTFSSYTYNSDNYPVTSTTTANFSTGFNGTVNVQYFY